MAEIVDAIQATAWDLVRELESLTAQGRALLDELDEAWGMPISSEEIVTVRPHEDRPTLPA